MIRISDATVMQLTLRQKLAAEAVGTAILVFVGAGSIPLTAKLTHSDAIGSAELNTIAFAFAVAIFAAVYSIGHISGCHINPAVTVALFVAGRIDRTSAFGYVVAQLAGGTVGAVLILVLLLGNDPSSLGLGSVGWSASPGGPVPALASEAIGTAILVFTVFGAALDERAPRAFGGIVVGCVVFGLIVVIGPITGSALNPARQIGPMVIETIIGFAPAPDRIGQLWVYVVGPLSGGLGGAALYRFVGEQRTPAVRV